MNFNISDRELTINDHFLNFDQRIVKAVELDAKVIVLLNSDDFEEGDELVGRNIVAYDSNGELAWRIERHGFSVRNRKGDFVPQAYFGLWIDEDGETLRAGIPVADFKVDPSNGMLLEMEQSRW